MTENSEPNSAGKTHASSRNPALEGDSGQYVEGDYGDAGVVGDDARADTKGQYSGGDRGDAGSAEGPADAEAGAYATGDYGGAGAVGQELPAGQAGEYSEGDYGAAGTAPERGEADELKDELIDGQVNAPKNNGGGSSSRD
ncbi:hypothetical protein [Arthrobacter pascens]|uniref:hypothetical protein n=1 Tax=Arthrobacter pascens TaxID=1677 RepID=UPI00196B1695|nr:hypothetical protein [Arthrobacter pascens]MBN3497465.1 hypothetical protein [Arthrobacter pascens]